MKDKAFIILHRVLAWRKEYKYFCPYCLAQYKEKPEQCIFFHSREIKENIPDNYLFDNL